MSNVIAPDYNSALSLVPYGPQPQGSATPFAYYYAPGGAATIVPTIFTLSTAPATVALIRDTVQKLVDHVEKELTVVAVQVIGLGLAKVLIPAAAKIGTRLGGGGAELRQPSVEEEPRLPAPGLAGDARPYVPRRLSDPDGERIPIEPQRQLAVFHSPGERDPSPEIVLKAGLPARGTNVNLWDHLNQVPGSAFRGTTLTPGQAASWDSAVVYKIRNIDTYDLNAALAKKDKGNPGFSGNPMHGESEFAIKARVPASQIEGYYPVADGKLGKFVPNPQFGSGE